MAVAVSYIPAIRSLVVETEGSGYMTTGTQAGYDAKALTLPSEYRPPAERCVCLWANVQINLSLVLRVQADGGVFVGVRSSGPMNGFGWSNSKVLIPL